MGQEEGGGEGAGEPIRTELSALMSVFQCGQGRQSLGHVFIELGQALLLVVLICTRLHCNENRGVNSFLWLWPWALEMALQTHLEISLSPTSSGAFLLQFYKVLGIIGLLWAPGPTPGNPAHRSLYSETGTC